MSVQEMVVHMMEHLPPEKQQDVLDFARSLAARGVAKQPRVSVKGLWADLNINISAEDIDEARCEMWGNFPREDIA